MILRHLQTKIPEERVIFSAGQDLQYLKWVVESCKWREHALCWGDNEVQQCSKCRRSSLGPSPHLKSVVSPASPEIWGTAETAPLSSTAQLLVFDRLGCECQPVCAAAAATPIRASHFRATSSLFLLVTAPITWAAAAHENILDSFDWLPSRLD